MTIKTNLYLASQSPRRSELLTQIGVSFSVLPVDIDETAKQNEIPEDYVIRLAKEKAVTGWNTVKEKANFVLGSDTAVIIDGEILGKPESHADAKRMLNLLSGKSHQVMSAVALAGLSENHEQPELSCVISVSEVTFKPLSANEIEWYVESGESTDKAGSYAIQGLAASFITHLSGSYSGVMGLPLHETSELLKKAGISTDSLVLS